MDFIAIGSALGILSTAIHGLHGATVLMRHFKITSTCCNLKSSLEVDVGTPTNQQPLNNGSPK